MAATKARSSVRNYGIKLRLEQELIKKFQGDFDGRIPDRSSKTHRSSIVHDNFPEELSEEVKQGV